MSGNGLLNLMVKFGATDKLSGALRNIIGLGRSGSTALGGLNREAGRLKGEMSDVARQIARATGNVTNLVDREAELAAQLNRVNAQIARQKALNTANAQAARIEARGEAMKGKGQENITEGAAMAFGLGLATKAAMDFSSGMVDIQQKANLSNQETAQMARNVLALAKAAHQLPEDMRSGIDALSGLGLDPRLAIQMIGPIGRLGTAFKVDLADGANAAFANMNNLKVPLAQTSRALDIMAASGNAGAFEVKDMARWFPALTAQAQALGQTGTAAVADLAAALQIARRGTGDADSAATNVQNLLTKINAPGTIAAFQKNFGVDLPAAMKRAAAEGKTPMEAIAELTKKVTGGDLSKIGFAFQDMQVQGALRSLIQNLDDYRAIRAQVMASGGTVDKAFNQRAIQDASVNWRDFQGTTQRTAIILGNRLLPSITVLMSTVGNMVDRVGAWADANPRLATGLATLVTTLVAAKIGIGALQLVFGGMLGPLATGWRLFAQYRAVGSIAAMFPNAAAAFTKLGSAAMWLGRIMVGAATAIGWPWLVAIAVIAAVAYAVYSHWDQVKAAFASAWANIKSVWDGAPGWFKNLVSNVISGMVIGLVPGGELFAAGMRSIAQAGMAAFKAVFGIKSPSRLMIQMGGHITEGLGRGIDGGGRRPLGAMSRLATGMAGAGAFGLSAAMAGPGIGAAPAKGGMARAGGNTFPITIIQRPGEDAEELAERVAAAIERKQRRNALGSYGDDF